MNWLGVLQYTEVGPVAGTVHMPYVRGHYRRPRGSQNALGGLALFALGGLGVILYGLYLLLLKAIEFAQANAVPLMIVGAVAVLIPTVIFVRRSVRRRRIAEYLAAVDEVLYDDIDVDRLATLRAKAAPLTSEAEDAAEATYRELVAKTVEDRQVTPREQERLAAAERALELSPLQIERARVEGFLQVFNALVADCQLTTSEDETLATLQRALAVPAERISEQLAFADQLRRARQLATSELRPIELPVKLRKGETCFYGAQATERKRVNARTFVRGGVRHVEQKYDAERAGMMYVTSERLLLVADGTNSIAKDAILDVAVDTENSLLVVTKDGRKAPYFFETSEPFVAAAIVDRLLRASGHNGGADAAQR